MRDAAGQFADRLHFLSHRELFARLNEFFLRVTSLGQVSKDIGKTDQISGVITNGRDRARDKKQRAILSDAPSLNFVLAPLNGQSQGAVRFASTALIRPIKYPEMLADDFFRGVSNDLLRGVVPAHNVSHRVERKNGIVDNAFAQNFEMALGAVERRICLLKSTVQLILHRKQMGFCVLAHGNCSGQNERRHCCNN